MEAAREGRRVLGKVLQGGEGGVGQGGRWEPVRIDRETDRSGRKDSESSDETGSR